MFNDLARYFTNLDQGESAVRSVDLFGPDKAKFLGDLVNEKRPGGTSSPFYRSFRLDRMISAAPRDFVSKVSETGVQMSKQRWMPTERVGNADVINSTDGLRIIHQDGKKFRLYGKDGALKGVYDTQREAEKKAAKTVRFKRSEEELTNLAKDSEGFKNWYNEFKGFLQSFLSEHADYAPLVSEFLNATSAATSVEVNVPRAVQALREFIDTGAFESFKLMAHKKNLERAARGEQLSGPKISQYSDAIFGNPNAIPVDRHIAQLLFNVDSPSTKQITSAKKRIRSIADRLGWTPSQVQAALWAANQKRKGQIALSYEGYLEKHRKTIFEAIQRDATGRGREAAGKIAARISAESSLQ